MLRIDTINFDPPGAAKDRIHFDNLIPLYPTSMLKLETDPRNCPPG